MYCRASDRSLEKFYGNLTFELRQLSKVFPENPKKHL